MQLYNAATDDFTQVLAAIEDGDSTGRIIIWDVPSTSRLVTLTDAGEAVTSLDWSSDGLSIVAGRDDGTIQAGGSPSHRSDRRNDSD